jgi:uncharacterized membrane protein
MEDTTWHTKKTWHQHDKDSLKFGQKLADSVANGMGSWRFIIWQTIIVALWMILNVILIKAHQWDSYPFILLNLVFSTQAAYAAPIIMMAQNRQSERDRKQADADFRTNCEAKVEIEELQKRLAAIEVDKLDKILAMLEQMDSKKS